VTDRVTARIDAHNGVLYARHADTRTATFHFALKAGDNCIDCALLRLPCLLRFCFAQQSLWFHHVESAL
jgi:hypothetical protein